MRESLQELLGRSPAVLDGREVGRTSTVEVVFEPVTLLLVLDNVLLLRSSSAVPAIVVFFKNEVVSSNKPGLHNWLENLISVHFKADLTVMILRRIEV